MTYAKMMVSEGEQLRRVMRHVPSPVVVVTARGTGEMRGITVGSFTSVSLDPCLISFNVRSASRMQSTIATCTHFAVHVLRSNQAYLSHRFAASGRTSAEQFEGVAYTWDAYHTPILADVLSVITCRRHRLVRAGDHVIVFGRVVSAQGGDSGKPLVYYRGAYREVGIPVATGLPTYPPFDDNTIKEQDQNPALACT